MKYIESFLFGLTTGISIVSIVQYFYTPKQAKAPLEPKSSDSVYDSLDGELTLSTSKLQVIVKSMAKELKKGLKSDDEILKMIPSFVTEMPSGNEKGTILALDLGGSNFRVCKVEVEGGGKVRLRAVKYKIKDEQRASSGEELFDFFACCVEAFCKDQDVDVKTKVVQMGFTFSFPVLQTSLNSGCLVKWTKGFKCSGVEGQDVVSLLQAAFERKGLNIEVTAIINDTVGTLIAHAYSDPQTYIAVILGTGTNAAYVEKIDQVTKWKGHGKEGLVVINTEWGNYGSGDNAALTITKWDRTLDRESSNAKKQILEKMISGLYLGEVCRLVLNDLIRVGEIFEGRGLIEKKGTFLTEFMARCERDHSQNLSDVKLLFEEVLKVPLTTLKDREKVKHVCELVGIRAARLSAAGIAAIVTQMNRLDGCTVAIDGSVFEHYPHFGNRMRDALHELLGIMAENVVLEQARDGSGIGAGLVALLHQETEVSQ